jgi:hypothetical protein
MRWDGLVRVGWYILWWTNQLNPHVALPLTRWDARLERQNISSFLFFVILWQEECLEKHEEVQDSQRQNSLEFPVEVHLLRTVIATMASELMIFSSEHEGGRTYSLMAELDSENVEQGVDGAENVADGNETNLLLSQLFFCSKKDQETSQRENREKPNHLKPP